VACSGQQLPIPTQADLTSAQNLGAATFAAQATVQDLEAGRALYANRCASCHQLFEPSAYPPHRWPEFVSEMRKQASLTAPQEQQLTWYLQAISSRGSVL
jgi:mono/diheme cytochrome c family protein